MFISLKSPLTLPFHIKLSETHLNIKTLSVQWSARLCILQQFKKKKGVGKKKKKNFLCVKVNKYRDRVWVIFSGMLFFGLFFFSRDIFINALCHYIILVPEKSSGSP